MDKLTGTCALLLSWSARYPKRAALLFDKLYFPYANLCKEEDIWCGIRPTVSEQLTLVDPERENQVLRRIWKGFGFLQEKSDGDFEIAIPPAMGFVY